MKQKKVYRVKGNLCPERASFCKQSCSKFQYIAIKLSDEHPVISLSYESPWIEHTQMHGRTREDTLADFLEFVSLVIRCLLEFDLVVLHGRDKHDLVWNGKAE